MKMNYEGYDSINLIPGEITVLGTDNRKVYSDIILGLQGFNDKIKFFDEDYRIVPTNKAMDWDGDIIDSQNLMTKYNTELVNAIVTSITDEHRNEINRCENQLYTALQDAMLYLDLPIEVSYDGDLKRVFKNSKIHLSPSICMDPYVIIETDFKLHKECNDTSCIGLSNVANYLSQDQFQEIVKLNSELQTSALIIEFIKLDNFNFYKNCNCYYIDEDFVDWRL
ncbi:MAG TPA: type II-A CRISPR-associated protein Csn2 [Candidatus Ligilactobacillus excrementigallinarum]|uniref:Type II-A CRISPR-associated protein Csn2 n=1 Tax=Candidatus Ligilactobacillus excrementigallinarum TaxID=2838641 RepID=A0A9D1UXN7_9LACO|nr:type II-A CRISPR-associated protein Csn2 [Candidatus Ligilactobacillus excrementigallinarum]